MSGIPDDVAPEFLSDSLRVVGRIGSTVVRRTGWWSPAVHRLLQHLDAIGFPESVRFLGLDADGNEVLTYIEGVSGLDGLAQVVPEAGLQEAARLVRRYHDAVRGYRPAAGSEWMSAARAPGDGDIVAHGDLGPWNMVWRDGRAVGLLDWDQAGPRPVLHDIAYALEYAVPFRDDETCLGLFAHPSVPDRAHRLRVFAAAYGLASTDGLVDAVIAEQEAALRDTLALAARGLHPQAEWVAEGFAVEQQARIDWSRSHRHLFD